MKTIEELTKALNNICRKISEADEDGLNSVTVRLTNSSQGSRIWLKEHFEGQGCKASIIMGIASCDICIEWDK